MARKQNIYHFNFNQHFDSPESVFWGPNWTKNRGEVRQVKQIGKLSFAKNPLDAVLFFPLNFRKHVPLENIPYF